jgi:hypothetical protein
VISHSATPADRISEIARVLGDPDSQRGDASAVHRCFWNCGCEAINTRGLCIEDGWNYAPCIAHPALARPTPPSDLAPNA